jgi:hypothetical protein
VKGAKKKQHRQLDAEGRKLLALAREFDRKDGNWNVRSKAEVVSEAELLALGGVKQVVWRKGSLQPQIIFGGESDAQLIFMPCNGAWKVSLEGKPSLEEQRRELSKAGRGLWDAKEQKPGVAFQAVEALLSCWQNFRGLPADDQQKAETHFAISRTLEALEQKQGRKLQLAFNLLTDDQWPRLIEKLIDRCLWLAVRLQRPPSKGELNSLFDPDGVIHHSEFAKLLKHAGLAWLRRQPSPRHGWGAAAHLVAKGRRAYSP